MKKNISVIGTGRLGLSMALLCESKGYSIVGIDKNESYIKQLQEKTLKSPEPQIEELLNNSKNIKFSTNIVDAIEHSDLLLCFVQTPSKEDDSYDSQYIEDVVKSIYNYYENGGDVSGKTLVINCTTMPKYCADLHDRISSIGVEVIYNPEFIKQGDIVNGLINADMVLLGVSIHENQRMQAAKGRVLNSGILSLIDVYKTIMDKEPIFKILPHTEAEITKVAINCYLVLKISYANAIGDLCIKSGIPKYRVDFLLDAVGSDSRIGKHCLGYGYPASGLCLPRDVRALECYSYEIKSDTSLISGMNISNRTHLIFMKDEIIENLQNKEDVIKIDQLSYKPNVPIITESQQLILCQMLLRDGYNILVTESESVIEQVKPILEKFGDKVNYTVRK